MENLEKSLKQLKIEDFIWITYFFITFSALYSNRFERDYLIHHNEESRKKFHEINTTIFIVTLIIYAYFVYVGYQGVKDHPNKDSNKLSVQELTLIGSILFFIGGAIFLYVELQGANEQEIAEE